MRRPIQMILAEPTSGDDSRPFVIVLCDDGSLWERPYHNATSPWQQAFPPIPDSPWAAANIPRETPF